MIDRPIGSTVEVEGPIPRLRLTSYRDGLLALRFPSKHVFVMTPDTALELARKLQLLAAKSLTHAS